MSTHPAQYDRTMEKWRSWITDRHWNKILTLHHDREPYKEMITAIRERVPESPGTFIEHYRRLYVSSAVMCVRRLSQSDDPGIVSLGRLLQAMATSPGVVTLDRDMRLAVPDGDDREWARQFEREWFLENWGDETGLRVERLHVDLTNLRSKVARIKRLADRSYAHMDRRTVAQSDPPTFQELDEGIDIIGTTCRSYYRLLSGSSLAEVAPVIQQDWKATLRVPLFEPHRRTRPSGSLT